jgi:hypothetical protein
MSILSISSNYVDDAVYLVQIYRYFNSGIEPVNATTTASFRRKVATTLYYKAFHYLEVSGIRTTKYEAPVVEDFVSGDPVRRANAIVHLNSLVVWVLLTSDHKDSDGLLEIVDGPLTEHLPFSSINLLLMSSRSEKNDEMWVTSRLVPGRSMLI